MIVYAYTWYIVLKRKWGRKTVSTETIHKLRGCVSNVIITGVSICLHLLHQFPESLQAWQHTMKDQSPATLKSVLYNYKWQDMTPFNLDSRHSQHHKKSVASNTTDRNHRYLPSYTNTLSLLLLLVFICEEFTNQALLLSHC